MPDDDDDRDDSGNSQSDQDGEQSAVGDDQMDSDDNQTMDDSGDSGSAEDGEMAEADGAEDGMSDGEAPNSDIQGHNQERGTFSDAYKVFDVRFDEDKRGRLGGSSKSRARFVCSVHSHPPTHFIRYARLQSVIRKAIHV